MTPQVAQPLRIAVLGAGALGSILAAHLIRAGHDVCVLARGNRAEQLRRRGIVLHGQLEATTACHVITDPDKIDAVDLLIVTVKAYDTESAIAPLQHLRPRSVFSVANGVLKNEQLQKQFGAAAVLGCMSDISGELRSTGEVEFTRNVGLHLGELDSANSGRLQQLVDAIHASDIPTFSHQNIESIEWSKYIGWMAVMAVSVLTRQQTWKYLADPDCAELIVKLCREARQLAQHRGIELLDMSPFPTASICSGDETTARHTVQELGRAFRERAPSHRMSALQDLEKGRRLEVEQTLGYAIARGRQCELAMPSLQACYHLVAAADRFRRDNP